MSEDQYVAEIRAIRQRQYEETKEMTWEEREQYTRERSERVRKQLAEIRAQKKSEEQLIETGKSN